MAGWMSGRGVNVKKVKEAESGGGWKNGDKVNCLVERIALDSTDNESVVKQHGAGAENFINVMLRVQGDKDGRFKKSTLFHKLYPGSENAVRAASDCQYLACYAAIKDEEDKGYYADLIESDEEPDNEILADMIGLMVGVEVGVMNQGGRESVFVRKLSMPFDWDSQEKAQAGGDAGGRSRGRGRSGGDAEEAQQPRGRGRSRA